jgi:hypothetical protein
MEFVHVRRPPRAEAVEFLAVSASWRKRRRRELTMTAQDEAGVDVYVRVRVRIGASRFLYDPRRRCKRAASSQANYSVGFSQTAQPNCDFFFYSFFLNLNKLFL